MNIETCEYLENIQEQKEYMVQKLEFPTPISKVVFDAVGLKTNEKYKIDVANKTIALSYNLKVTMQNRMRTGIHLLRLDVGGGPHQNPDGEKINGAHLHVYHQDFGDTYAYSLDDPNLKILNPLFDFTKLKNKDHKLLFEAFNELCNFVGPLIIVDPFA